VAVRTALSDAQVGGKIARTSRLFTVARHKGKIAQVEVNNNEVQKPLDSLTRMHAIRPRQEIFNQRVLMNEDLVSPTNSTLADFLNDFDVRPEAPVYMCVNVANCDNGWQPTYGRLWAQEGRKHTATSPAYVWPDAEPDISKEHTALCGVMEALAWRHALEMSDDASYLSPDREQLCTQDSSKRSQRFSEQGSLASIRQTAGGTRTNGF
jgi:hypothetical protein